MSLKRVLSLGLATLSAWLVVGPGSASAICPSKVKGPGGALPPGIREPFDPEPPPAEPEDP
jgi:hypothetical protein